MSILAANAFWQAAMATVREQVPFVDRLRIKGIDRTLSCQQHLPPCDVVLPAPCDRLAELKLLGLEG